MSAPKEKRVVSYTMLSGAGFGVQVNCNTCHKLVFKRSTDDIQENQECAIEYLKAMDRHPCWQPTYVTN